MKQRTTLAALVVFALLASTTHRLNHRVMAKDHTPHARDRSPKAKDRTPKVHHMVASLNSTQAQTA